MASELYKLLMKHGNIIDELDELSRNDRITVDTRIEFLRMVQNSIEEFISELQTEDGDDE